MISIRHRAGELHAENARYNPLTNIANVDGALSYQTDDLLVHSSDARIDLGDGTFQLGESGYEIESGDVVARGHAEQINRDTKGRLILDDATYSLSLIHISEPTRQEAISYAVFCLKKKK